MSEYSIEPLAYPLLLLFGLFRLVTSQLKKYNLSSDSEQTGLR